MKFSAFLQVPTSYRFAHIVPANTVTLAQPTLITGDSNQMYRLKVVHQSHHHELKVTRGDDELDTRYTFVCYGVIARYLMEAVTSSYGSEP